MLCYVIFTSKILKHLQNPALSSAVILIHIHLICIYTLTKAPVITWPSMQWSIQWLGNITIFVSVHFRPLDRSPSAPLDPTPWTMTFQGRQSVTPGAWSHLPTCPPSGAGTKSSAQSSWNVYSKTLITSRTTTGEPTQVTRKYWNTVVFWSLCSYFSYFL